MNLIITKENANNFIGMYKKSWLITLFKFHDANAQRLMSFVAFDFCINQGLVITAAILHIYRISKAIVAYFACKMES